MDSHLIVSIPALPPRDDDDHYGPVWQRDKRESVRPWSVVLFLSLSLVDRRPIGWRDGVKPALLAAPCRNDRGPDLGLNVGEGGGIYFVRCERISTP